MYGLIGRSLSHSFSPQIHSEFADYKYELFEMEENEVGIFLKNSDLNGINVTIPYKKAVIPYLDRISDCAKKIGAVNTVKRCADGSLFGDNTDYYGFKYTLENRSVAVAGKKCIVLGSGGASLTANAVLHDMGADSVITISRSGKNNYGNISEHFDSQIIVNTTPVGMYPNCGSSLIQLSDFKQCEFVFDIIYNPAKTELLLQAEKLGIPYANGLVMLVAQAKKACEIFTDTVIPDEKISSVTSKIANKTLNIVLVGMPGSGKSTLGKLIAKKLDRKFVDTDTEIEDSYGASIPDIFAANGEAFFRSLENDVVAECGKQSSTVIATGGGAILNEKNITALRQNGIIVFINRSLNELARNGRPLSKDAEALKKLYETRMPIYKQCADIEVAVDASPEQLAARIIAELSI